jgi:RNA polymerase sigma factor (sigma-70 family)
MSDTRTDAQLVTAYTAGDRSALAGIYDRYSAGLYDTSAAMLRDRHEAADAMQDVFLIAAERIGQLRDPERLKPWLYAILRNEVYRRTKRRGRSLPTDFSAMGAPEMAAPMAPDAEGEGLAAAELGELVRSAACGLDERDQLVLELSTRQGLQGADLAAALGVSAEQSYTLVHRMRERVERSLGALVVARAGRKDCPDLADVLKGWDGQFTVLVRKRVARHIEHCETCERTRRKAAPLALLGAAPAFAAPLDLRDAILSRAGTPGAAPRHAYQFDAEGGFPRLVRHLRWGVLAAAAAVVVLLGVGGGVLLAGTGDDGGSAGAPTTVAKFAGDAAAPTAATTEETSSTATPSTATTAASTAASTTAAATTAAPTSVDATVVPTSVTATTVPRTTVPRTTVPRTTVAPSTVPATAPPPPTPPPTAPGAILLSNGIVDLGATAGSGAFQVTNPGGAAMNWSLSGDAGEFGVGALGGSVPPGGSTTVTVTLDRNGRPEGDLQRSLTLVGDPGGPQLVVLRARVERPPTVAITAGPSGSKNPACQLPTFVSASYADESAIATMTLRWDGPVSGSMQMGVRTAGTAVGNVFAASPNVPPAGSYTYTVIITDARGNTGTASNSFTTQVC